MSDIDVTIENISEITVTVDDDKENITVVLQPAASGGTGNTNLGYTASPSQGIVTSDSGTDATIPAADGTNAGLFLPAEKTKLSGIATGATANSSDATLLARANHTGTQAIATVDGLQTALDGKQASGSYATTTDLTNGLATKEPTIAAGTTGQYWRGDKSWQTLDKSAVGLGNVVNADTTTTANITDSLDKRFVTDANLTVIGNTSGTNTGDQTIALTGDVTGSGTGSFAVTLANTSVTPGSYGAAGSVGTFTVDSKGRLTAASNTAIAITESQISDLGTSVALVTDNLSVFASTTSSQLAGVISDETGSGALVFGTSPTLASPALTGTPTAPTATTGTNTTQLATTAFVQAELAAITEGLTIVQTTSATLAPTPGNYYLVDGTTTVNLPAGSNGDVIGIADGASNFGTANCTINPNGAQTIAGETAVTLTADNAYIVLAFWGARWTIIHGNSFIQPDPSPLITTLTTGSGSFVQNALTRLLRVRVWGATGGGGGVDGQGAGTLAIGQAGGNGSYAEKWISITPGETFSYSIGAAGVGGAAGANNGTSGGITSFVGTVSGTVQVTGGVGGTGTLGAAFGNVGQALPGVPTGGDLNIVGHRTVNVRWLDGLNYSFPNNGVPLLGNSQQTTSSGDGADSLYYSAGGMGAFVTASTTNFAGGDGYGGLIIVEEWA